VANPGEREALDSGLVDFVEDAVTVRSVVTRISRPGIGSRLEQRLGIQTYAGLLSKQYERHGAHNQNKK